VRSVHYKIIRFLYGKRLIQGFLLMHYETKLQLAHKELSDKGVWKSNYDSPLVKLLRKLGLCFPPPYYQSFFANVMLCVAFFAPVWGFLQWLFVWNELGKPVLEAVYI